MAHATSGNTVKIHYRGTLTDGSEFDSSRERQPLEFTLGSGSVIPGFDKAVDGMTVGENKSFTIPCDEAYGPHNPNLIQEVPRGELPEGMEPQLGMRLSATVQGGQQIDLVVTRVTDETVHLDANHPLAGEDLTFEVELIAID